MKHKISIKKTLLSLVLATAILSSVFATARAELPASQKAAAMPEGYALCAENGSLKLYLDRETTSFCVENIADGSVWYSNPPDAEQDRVAAGLTMTEMQSLFSVVYYGSGADSGAVQDCINSYSSGVLNDDAAVKEIDGGFEVTYILDEEILSLPIRVVLTDDGLVVTMQTTKMKVGRDYSVESISMLPYFGAAAATDNGYFLVPDGCGGLIEFGTAKKNVGSFSKRIYGDCVTDPTGVLENPNEDTRAALPVYGIQKNGSAVLAQITDGAALATVESETSGINSSYATVYPTFHLYSNMEYSLSSTSTVIFEKKGRPATDCKVVYRFLSGEDADYNGMAKCYRNVLMNDGVLTESPSSAAVPYLSVYGGIVAKRSYFGFLIDTVIPMTTSAQLVKLTDEAKKQGITKPTVNFLNWNSRELMGKSVNGMMASNKVIKGKYNLKKLLASKDFTFYPAVSNLLSYTKTDLIGSFTKPVADISGVTVYRRKISPTVMEEYGKRTYFLNAKFCGRNLNRLAKSVSKKKIGRLSLSDLSGMLYEDFRDESFKRFDFEKLFAEKLQGISKKSSLMLNNPNVYALKYAKSIINLPTKTDRQMIVDRDVPFVQLVLNGCVSYATEALNYTDVDEAILKTLETGSMPHYFVYYGKESELKSTDYSSLCGGNYQTVLPKMAKVYKAVQSVREKTGEAAMTAHKVLSEGVRAAIYGNGTVVYVNYGAEDYSLGNGTAVPAGGYLIGEEVR